MQETCSYCLPRRGGLESYSGREKKCVKFLVVLFTAVAVAGVVLVYISSALFVKVLGDVMDVVVDTAEELDTDADTITTTLFDAIDTVRALLIDAVTAWRGFLRSKLTPFFETTVGWISGRRVCYNQTGLNRVASGHSRCSGPGYHQH